MIVFISTPPPLISRAPWLLRSFRQRQYRPYIPGDMSSPQMSVWNYWPGCSRVCMLLPRASRGAHAGN